MLTLNWLKKESAFKYQPWVNPEVLVLRGQLKRQFRLFLLVVWFLIIFLFALPAFAGTPTLGTITPASGTSQPDTNLTFTSAYSDAGGYTHLKECYLLINFNSTSFTNTAYLYYDRAANLLYLRNDANTAWSGGFAPGTANVIENSQAKLNCATTTISGTANTLTISWNAVFKPIFSGKTYNTYLYVKDSAGAYVNWTRRGTWTVNRAPALGTLSPASGTGQANTAQTFTSTFTDSDGWQNIQYVYFLINTSASGLNCFYGYYNQNTNRLYLRNDANTAWLGGFAPGTVNVIENSYAKLDCSGSTFTVTGTTLTVNWKITLKTPFTGAKNAYLYVRDDVNAYVNYTSKGTWSIPNNPPVNGTITPASGSSFSGQAVTFTSTYSDPDTWLNIQNANLLINTSTAGTICFYAYYNQNSNRLYLRNDANTSWGTGYAPGAANVLENTYAKLNCAGTTISGTGNNLCITWSITFKTAFSGTKNTYLYVNDDANASQSWTQKGVWSIQSDTTPPTGTGIINNNAQYTNLINVTLNLSATDSGSGMGAGAQMQFSNDNASWSIPENYALTKSWPLFPGEGAKAVYVKFKDAAGNWSTAVSDAITLDTTAPAILINPVLSPTNETVALSYTLNDNFTASNEITITGDNSPYINDGVYNVTLTAKDKANNSSSASLSFTIDKHLPVIVITSPEDGSVSETAQITLTGTVDGVNFSETRTLQNEGTNTVTKTVVDAAGNSNSVSLTVYLYSGTVIGSAGGEVSSPDGKVKIKIPAGALSAATTIKILPVSIQDMGSSTPAGRALLSVVECKPYGLVFSVPASIIYTLSSAEIPGTPVELGYYDSVQRKIISTGQVSTIPADGYTATFPVSHFSTYAALKNLTSQGIPIGGGVKIPLPDMLTGAFGHSIPLSVPQGRKGIQPSIGLNYRSVGANSWVGLGFSLNPGYIVRSTRLGPPTYNDTQDTFYLITDAGTTELVNLVDNLYQAKIESSFTKFYKEPDDSWKAVGKDGSVLRFGQTSGAKETATQGTFSWFLTKAIDNNGNYMEYSYIKDQGKCYLSRIDYTGNEVAGVSPVNSVEFFLEARTDLSSSYISGSKVATARRLREVQAKVNLELAWRYVLEYNYSPDTSRSLLKSVTQYAADGATLPAQGFKYQRAK
ncbi:MAG: SpvB/TcaC N-terminal domain-containing protein [Candidatus Omnitrophota bacterium]